MTTKENIIKAANTPYGGFVNTDGTWCMTRTPAEFKNFLENEYGFDVIICTETPMSTAIAITADGIKISWNGHCRKNTVL